MKYFIFFIINCFLFADNLTYNKTSNIDTPLLDSISNIPSSIQNNINKENDNPYKALDLVFPNSHIERVLKGLVSYIEEVFLKIDIRRIALDFSSTNINVSREYRDLQVNQFNGDNSILANFNADLALEYNFENSRVSTNLVTKYGVIILTPNNKPSTKTETSDEIVFNIGYTRKALQFEEGFIGPFIDGEYQTEFTRNIDSKNNLLPRNQILRYKGGIRLLDGKYIDEVYIAGVGEVDFSYSPNSIRGATEIGLRAKTLITDDIKLVYQGFYRQYVGFNIPRNNDLLYNINLTARLDVGIYKGFAFSPFISARFAKIRIAKNTGNNITTGISLLYSSSINAISSIQTTQNAKLKQYYKAINE